MMWFIKKFPKLISLSIILLLSSCSLLMPVREAPQKTYLLTAVPVVPQSHTHHLTLLVFTPDTQPVYNTTQMAYSVRPYQIAYFSQHQWAETPSQMLQPLLVQTLQNTHYYHAVVTQPYIGSYDYALTTQILELKQDFTCHPAMLRFKIRAQLTSATTNRVIGTRVFSAAMPIREHCPYSGVYAANQAISQLLTRIAAFCTHS